MLYSGAVEEAGSVRARKNSRHATSDWMAMEQQRGITVTSAVLQFDYAGRRFNLLDTPGHQDFSEDTYRVLAAVDSAVMVIDAAKGIEPQTLKLFEVCRMRGIPLVTFVNKMDQPALDPLELLDDIESQLGSSITTPVTWPVGIAGDFRGLVDRRSGDFTRFTRTARRRRPMAPEELVDADRAAAEEAEAWDAATEELALLDEIGAEPDPKSFLAAEATPLFVGSALTNFGVGKLLDAVIDYVPPPSPRLDVAAVSRGRSTRPFSGIRVQGAGQHGSGRTATGSRSSAVCSGQFERGIVVTHGRTGQAVRDEVRAPGVRPGARDRRGGLRRRCGRPRQRQRGARGRRAATLGRSGGRSRRSRSSPPSTSRLPGCGTPRSSSSSAEGIAQLDEEGVVQVLRDRQLGDQAPYLAAVGPMQFEVALHRLENEFGAPVAVETRRRYRVATAHRRGERAATGVDDGGEGRRALERRAAGAVRESVLGRPPRARPPRADPRPPRRRGHRGLTRINPPKLRSNSTSYVGELRVVATCRFVDAYTGTVSRPQRADGADDDHDDHHDGGAGGTSGGSARRGVEYAFRVAQFLVAGVVILGYNWIVGPPRGWTTAETIPPLVVLVLVGGVLALFRRRQGVDHRDATVVRWVFRKERIPWEQVRAVRLSNGSVVLDVVDPPRLRNVVLPFPGSKGTFRIQAPSADGTRRFPVTAQSTRAADDPRLEEKAAVIVRQLVRMRSGSSATPDLIAEPRSRDAGAKRRNCVATRRHTYMGYAISSFFAGFSGP
ncbi:MAG: GTP-binding protein [Acidimicrobiia bacterium]|nr:GTP-binding protein [Acidimicrobiia bacterium]